MGLNLIGPGSLGEVRTCRRPVHEFKKVQGGQNGALLIWYRTPGSPVSQTSALCQGGCPRR